MFPYILEDRTIGISCAPHREKELCVGQRGGEKSMQARAESGWMFESRRGQRVVGPDTGSTGHLPVISCNVYCPSALSELKMPRIRISENAS